MRTIGKMSVILLVALLVVGATYAATQLFASGQNGVGEFRGDGFAEGGRFPEGARPEHLDGGDGFGERGREGRAGGWLEILRTILPIGLIVVGFALLSKGYDWTKKRFNPKSAGTPVEKSEVNQYI